MSASQTLWGIDQWRYIPAPFLFILIVFGVLPLIPSVRSTLAGMVSKAVRPEKRETTLRGRAIPVLLAIVSVALIFWLFRQKTHFLGDGYLWIKFLESGDFSRYWDLTALCLIYNGIHRFLNIIYPFGDVGMPVVATGISISSGLIFLIFAWKSARVLFTSINKTLFIFLAVLSSGSIMLFFGYIEAYPPVALAAMIYIYYGLLFLRGRTSLLAPAAALLLALLLHPSMAALFPGLLILCYLNRGKRPGWRRYFLVLTTSAAGCFILLYIFQQSGIFPGFFNESFLPLFDGSHLNRVPYPVLSKGSAADLLGEILLVCPVVVLVSAVFFRKGKMEEKGRSGRKGKSGAEDRSGTDGPSAEILFLLTVSVFFVLEFMVTNKLIGASRDWDIFASMALPMSMMTALLLLHYFRDRVAELIVFTFFIMILHTATWIGINASEEASLDRFSDLIENYSWSDYARGYANDELATFYLDRGDESRALDFSRKSIKADPGNIRYLYNAATRHMICNRHDETIRLYRRVLEKNPDYLEARLNLGTLFFNLDRLDEAGSEFLDAIRLDSTSAIGHEKLAHICLRKGIFGRAVGHFEKYLSIEPEDVDVRFELAMLLDRLDDSDGALRQLNRVLQLRRDDVSVMNNIGVIHCKRREYSDAVLIFDKALQLNPDQPSIHGNLARVHYLEGYYEMAWEHVFKAERLGGVVPPDLLSSLEAVMDRPAN
ncbi:MAG: tetratricopeptide repeat protein [Bacteroidales bacterium]|nr:tetratricopeptide repeat protein [Candidatus Latescibacterota bacterium]